MSNASEILSNVSSAKREEARWNIRYEMQNETDFYEICNDEEEVRELFNYFGGNSIIHHHTNDYEDNLWDYYHMGIVGAVEEMMYEKYGDDYLNDEHWDEFVQTYVDEYFELANC